ncbi:MAG TPA: tyrosine-type recombinase/integrase [Allosphingosinicella sp.]|jgi:hypothetical protein
MRVPLSYVHADDRVSAVTGSEVELDLLKGRTVRMVVKATCAQLGTAKGTLRKMIALKLVSRGASLRTIGRVRRWWIEIDPAITKRDLYDTFVKNMPVPKRHIDFDRYLRVREACSIPAWELPPPVVVKGMVPLLLQIGSTAAPEIAAFTPRHPKIEAELVRLANAGATRAILSRELPSGARPTDAMILEIAPALRGAPGTVFDKMYGGEDLARPKDNALCIAWALGPVRPAALLWTHLAAASRRTPPELRAGVRRLAMLDKELATHGARADDPVAIGKALHAIAFGGAWAHLKPAARASAARMLMLMIRHLRVYAARNDPEGSRGLAAMVPAQHPDRLAFAARVEATFNELGKIGRELRKARSDRAADRYAAIIDIAALRTEQVIQTQAAATAAARTLLQRPSSRADKLMADGTHAPAALANVDDGEDFVEFGVLTTVMTPKGRLLPGSQTCWWRAWRERDLWRDLARRQKKMTRNGSPSLFLRMKEIEADPDAYSGIVYEWRRCVPEEGAAAIEPWFVSISNLGVLNPPASLTAKQRRRRHSLIVNWNIPTIDDSIAGLLNFDLERNTLWRAASARNRFIVPVEQFAFAMRFAQLGLNAVDESLCRISEFLQMRQDKSMWPTSGETGSNEISFLAVPKKSRFKSAITAVPFQVEQVTFMEATELAKAIARRDGHEDGLLPEVPATETLAGKYSEREAWIFQAGGRAIDHGSMTRFLRFLLANVVDVTYHELRHAASNAARQAGVPEEAIQRLMNHRTIQQTKWYIRNSQKQRLQKQVARARNMKARSATRRSVAAAGATV